tara:strand:+ start:19 stop:225 length:207 start_codon:yes stop_codon:yes gene_type:complete
LGLSLACTQLKGVSMNYKDKFKDPIVYDKSFVVYSCDKDLTAEELNKILKEFNVTTRELTDEEVIYHI